MPRQLRRLVAIPIVATVLLIGSPAKAQFDLESTQDVILGVDGSIEGTLSAIGTYLAVMLPLIEEAIASSAASHAQANHVMLEGSMRINDAHQATQWSLSRAEAQGESANTAQPSSAACQPADGTRLQSAHDLPDRVETSSIMTGMLNRMGNVQGTNTQYGTFAGLVKDATYDIKYYGSQQELCPNSGGCTSGAMPDSDVRADTLFQDTYITGSPPGPGTAPDGTTISAPATGPAPSWTQAAKDYCGYLTNTGDLDPLQNNLLGTPQGVAEFSMRKAGDARVSLAQMVCGEMVAEREPNTNPISTWGQKIVNNLINTYNISVPIPTQNFSTYNVEKILAHDQFADPNWEQMLASEHSPAAILKDMNMLEAASLQMQWHEYNSLERVKLLEAVSLATEVEKTRRNVPTTALPAN